MSDWIKKQGLTISDLQEIHFMYKDNNRFKIKGYIYTMLTITTGKNNTKDKQGYS